MPDEPVLGAVGPRLRAVRQQRGATLASVSAATGISVSTLSRLESGGRKPTLELLLALAPAYQVPLDELVGCGPRPPPARWERCSGCRPATRTTFTRRWTGCCPASRR